MTTPVLIVRDARSAWMLALSWAILTASLALAASVPALAGDGPEARLVVLATGNSNGIFDPCRCPSNPYGGMAKRCTIVRMRRRDAPDLVLVDSGDVFHPDMARERAELLGKAYGMMEYDAVALGDNDLQVLHRWGATWFAGLKLPWVCVNADIVGVDVGLRRYRIVQRGTWRVAVTGVLSPSLVHEDIRRDPPEVRVSPPAAELEKLAVELRGKADWLIVLAHVLEREAASLTERMEDADVLVLGHATRLGAAGATRTFGVGQHGQHVLAIDVGTARSAARLRAVESLPLDDDVENDPALWAMYEAHLRQMEGRPSRGPAQTPGQVGDEGAASTAGPQNELRPAVHVTFFDAPGCRQCARVRRLLEAAAGTRPQIKLHAFSTVSPAHQELQEAMAAQRGVSQERRLLTPMVVVGEHVLIGEDVSARALEDVLMRYMAGGAVAPDIGAADLETAHRRLTDRWRAVSLIAVVVGGLIDGVNPCAFATIILFVSFMAAAGRSRRQVVAFGASFIVGVFVAYFAIGLGLSELAILSQKVAFLDTIVTSVLVAACLILAVLSAVDAVKAARGDARGVILQVPKPLKRQIRLVMTRFGRARYLLPAGFIVGALISALELACTGQVYLPTIRFAAATASSKRAAAVGLLAIYNLCFVAPLCAVFWLVYMGTTWQELAAVLARHLCAVKVAMSLLFLGLGVLAVITRV